jgi:thiol:disulfide interchange protein DsbD
LVSYGYEDEVMLVATITPPSKIESSSVTIGAAANWLVCEKSCIAGDAKLSIVLPVGASRAQETELFARWAQRLPKAVSEVPAIAAVRVEPFKGNELTVNVVWKDAAPEGIEWFSPASESLMFGKAPNVSTTGKTTTIRVSVEPLAGPSLPRDPLSAVLAFKGAQGRVGVFVPVDFQP